MVAEIHASPAYNTEVLNSGACSADFLRQMAERADDYVHGCCQVPENAVKTDNTTDITIFCLKYLLYF